MKRIVVFALILNAALLGVIAQQFIALAGDDGPLATRQNGDVNGDQILDMSDAVYLLIHLFNGGPEPVALADSPEVLERLDTLEATQGALQQGLTDLEADLPELTNDTILWVSNLSGYAVRANTRSSNCCGSEDPPDETYFSADGSSNGTLPEEDGRVYFRTDRDSLVLLEADLRFPRPSGRLRIFSAASDGEIISLSHSQFTSSVERIMPRVIDLPAGEYYLDYYSRVPYGGRCGWDCEIGIVGRAEMRIQWLSIKYLR